MPPQLEYTEGIKFAHYVLGEQGIALSNIEKVAIEAAWKGVTYTQITEERDVNINTIQNNVAPNLWKTLSGILGKRVGKKNFKELVTSEIERFRQLGIDYDLSPSTEQKSPAQAEFASEWLPNIEGFIGRQKEVADLSLLVKKYQLTLLVGIEGIGKKSLVSKMIQVEKERLSSDQIIWKSLHYQPTVGELAADICSSVEQSIELIDYLRKNHVLLVLDSLDSVFSSKQGNAQQNIADYTALLRRITEETPSTVIGISSRSIEQLESFVLRGRGIFYFLRGLPLEEASLILQNTWSKKQVEEICEAVEGNPLLLKKIAGNADYVNSEVLDHLTVQYGLVGTYYEQVLRNADLSSQDKSLLSHLARYSQGLLLSDVLSEHPSAAMKLKRLVDMGIATRYEDRTVAISPLFRQAASALGF